MSETKVITKRIDGKQFAENMCADITHRVATLKKEKSITPKLVVIRVGEDPASAVYVRNKIFQTKKVGMADSPDCHLHLPENTDENQLLAKIDDLNHDTSVHGILVQLPLPSAINKDRIIRAISPEKDVDGFHPVNIEKLEKGEDGFVPCTPMGCLMLIKDNIEVLKGKHAVVMGRSTIVGKPMAHLLRKEGCPVNVIHSQTTPEDRANWLKDADIVVVAVGKHPILKGTEIKPGAVIIDVGINHVTLPDGKTKLVGDVDFASCQGIASAITPVPGGVGPMTIACLLENTYKAASR